VTARAAAAAAAALALALGCAPPEPEPLARVVEVSPEGSGVAVDAVAFVRFSAPVAPGGLLDGARLVLVEAEGVRDAVAAVESDAGASGVGIAADAALDEGGRRAVLRPVAPLRGYTPHALVLSSRARAADGRPVLDRDGRQRTTVARFDTGAPPGPPPEPALTEVRVDAETPEAGGEYVEVANLGAGPLDLAGWHLSKRTASGAVSSCAVLPPAAGGTVAPGALAIVAGGAYDGRYALPGEVLVHACGATALLGGIANDRGPEIRLANPLGQVLATIGAGGAPACAAALEKIDPRGADERSNLACTAGSPGLLP
jgi:hypothetical protein